MPIIEKDEVLERCMIGFHCSHCRRKATVNASTSTTATDNGRAIKINLPAGWAAADLLCILCEDCATKLWGRRERKTDAE